MVRAHPELSSLTAQAPGSKMIHVYPLFGAVIDAAGEHDHLKLSFRVAAYGDLVRGDPRRQHPR